jgi:hypothetical protein
VLKKPFYDGITVEKLEIVAGIVEVRKRLFLGDRLRHLIVTVRVA